MRTFLLFMLSVASVAAQWPSSPSTSALEHLETYWPNGQIRSVATYHHDVRHGEYRTFREDGTRYELRHYDQGRESGMQQSWEQDGTLFLNYEVRKGRRYGFVNATPCVPAESTGSSRQAS